MTDSAHHAGVRKARSKRRSRDSWEQRILDRAPEVLARGGVDMPVSRLIAEIGVPVGTFYRLFPNVSALVTKLVEGHHAALMAAVSAEVGDGGTPMERLRRTVGAMIAIAASRHAAAARLYLDDPAQLAGATDVIRRLRDQDFAMIYGLLREGVASGEIECESLEVAAAVVLGAYRACVEMYLTRRDHPSLPRAAREAARLLVDGLARR